MVYLGQNRVSPVVLIGVALLLLGLRFFTTGTTPRDPMRVPLVCAGVGIVILAFVDDVIAVRVYPIFVSLSISLTFGYSLYRPPPLAERLARMRNPDLPPEGVTYCRYVTIVWTVFTLLNAAISFITMIWASIEVWALWNGLISYLLLGGLFVFELMLRHWLRRRWT